MAIRPRASSPADPAEWTVTEDGHPFAPGDRLYNYYDCKWGVVVGEIDHQGWFTFRHDDGTSTTLNSVRVASAEPRR